MNIVRRVLTYACSFAKQQGHRNRADFLRVLLIIIIIRFGFGVSKATHTLNSMPFRQPDSLPVIHTPGYMPYPQPVPTPETPDQALRCS